MEAWSLLFSHNVESMKPALSDFYKREHYRIKPLSLVELLAFPAVKTRFRMWALPEAKGWGAYLVWGILLWYCVSSAMSNAHTQCLSQCSAWLTDTSVEHSRGRCRMERKLVLRGQSVRAAVLAGVEASVPLRLTIRLLTLQTLSD